MLCRNLTESDIGKYYLLDTFTGVDVLRFKNIEGIMYIFEKVKCVEIKHGNHFKFQKNYRIKAKAKVKNLDEVKREPYFDHCEIFNISAEDVENDSVLKEKALCVYNYVVHSALFEISARDCAEEFNEEKIYMSYGLSEILEDGFIEWKNS